VGYFYLTNRAIKILVGDDGLILVNADPVSLLQVMIAVIVRPGVSITALFFA